MNQVYVFLIRNDIWIYILCGLGLFWYGSQWLQGRAVLRQAMFGLERERGTRLRNHALFFLAVLGAVAAAVAYVNIQIAPTLPASLLKPPTPTPDIFATPLASPLPEGGGELRLTPTSPVVATVTLPAGLLPGTPLPAPSPRPTAGGTQEAPTLEPGAVPAEPPTAAPPATANCPDNVTITQPSDGDQVAGLVPFIGSASAPNLLFYKLEIKGPETGGDWASVLGQQIFQGVVNGLLGSGNFTGWLPGIYSVRLTVVDSTSNEAGSCLIQINVGG